MKRLLEQPEEEIDLGRAAMLVARVEYPDLDVAGELRGLDALAADAAGHVGSHKDAAGRVRALRAFLAESCGFHGNESDYYDPRNSFLNDVLARRTGIPITLSVIYMEIGGRLSMPFCGVGLPGHFLVKYQDQEMQQILDPFHGGRPMTAGACREMVIRMFQGQIEFQDAMLAPVSKKYILLRMLHNLCSAYLRGGQWQKVLAVLEMLLEIDPGSSEDWKQRGLIHYKLRNYRQARRDLETYLFLRPAAADSEKVKQTLAGIQRVCAMLN